MVPVLLTAERSCSLRAPCSSSDSFGKLVGNNAHLIDSDHGVTWTELSTRREDEITASTVPVLLAAERIPRAHIFVDFRHRAVLRDTQRGVTQTVTANLYKIGSIRELL